MANKLNRRVLRHAIQFARGRYGVGDLPAEALVGFVQQALPGKASEQIVLTYAHAAAGILNSTSRMSEQIV